MKLSITAISKPKLRAVEELVGEYSRRISHYVPVKLAYEKDDERALKKIESSDYLVLLDEHGKEMTSRELSKWIAAKMSSGVKNVVMFVGGPDGAGDAVKKRANQTLSLSKMTLQHELALVILMEQIYRACSIMRGEPYHRD